MPPKKTTSSKAPVSAMAKKASAATTSTATAISPTTTALNNAPDNEVEETSTAIRKAPSMALKAVKAREKALADKIALVKSKIHTGLDKEDGVVVDCYHHDTGKNASLDKDTLDYVHLIKLSSPMPFVLVKQAKLEEGPYAGHVALILKQSLPFPFMKLPVAVRAKVFKYLLQHDEEELSMTLTQSSKKTAYCPAYRGKNKLAILATCKELRDEAAPIVYGQQFHFPGTQVIATFLLQINSFRKFLVYMHSDTYNASSARTMFHLLPEARALQRLSFTHVTSNEKPKTAVNNLYGDALPWLTIVGQVHQNPAKALRILKFDSAAFHRREKNEDGTVNVIQWDSGEQVLFWKTFKAKLESLGARTSKTPASQPQSPAPDME